MDNLNNKNLEEHLVSITPSKRQMAHQQLEFYGFFHYTINTYTGKEWGDGTESPSLFFPEQFNPSQWVRAIKSAGMKGAILTCKHHDGFCLWPSRYTGHTIAASPYKNGAGDIVKEVSEACRREGLKFGVYLSPWDRNHPSYGQGKAYDDYFVNQLTELLTQYGEIFCVWLDGACGEGKNGKIQQYDWLRYYDTIRRLQPDACISVTGPDVRWCGNEAADTRKEEWSVVPARMFDPMKIQENSQTSDTDEFRNRKISSSDQDLGSREALKGETALIWYPAEVDVSIRPGWFYHPEEDGQVRTPEELLEIYDRSVGGNALLLLNVPPMPNGLLNQRDVAVLEELGRRIRARQAFNFALEASQEREITDEGWDYLRLTWEKEVSLSFLVIQEDIRFSQRVEGFQIRNGDTGQILAVGTVIGYKKHIRLPRVKLKSLELVITMCRREAHILRVECY